MSLVAAVAVAGLTTISSAADLSEAIKNTTIGGSAAYRYDDRGIDNNGAGTNDFTRNSYKIVVAVKSKINDNTTLKVAGVGAELDSDTSNSTSGAPNVGTIARFSFIYTGVKNTTISLGKIGLATPFTVASDAMGNTQRGDGVLAVTKAGPVTLIGGYFNQTDMATTGSNTLVGGTGGEDVVALGANVSVANVALDAFFVDRDELYDVYTLGASTTIEGVSAYIRHSALDQDAVGTDDSLTKLGAKAKFGIVGVGADYGWTNKEGGLVAEDADAKAAFQGWGLSINGVADASLLKTNVNVQINAKLNLAANYNVLEYGNESTGNVNQTDKEIYAQATYKPSANLMTYVRFGEVQYDDAENGTRGRLHVQYNF